MAPDTSGSPIVVDDGRAVGIVCVELRTHGATLDEFGLPGQPRLLSGLPGWLLDELNGGT
jgi:hypothetical protein